MLLTCFPIAAISLTKLPILLRNACYSARIAHYTFILLLTPILSMFIVILFIPYVYIRIYEYTFNIDSLTDYKYKHLNYAVIARLAQNNIDGGRSEETIVEYFK